MYRVSGRRILVWRSTDCGVLCRGNIQPIAERDHLRSGGRWWVVRLTLSVFRAFCFFEPSVTPRAFRPTCRATPHVAAAPNPVVPLPVFESQITLALLTLHLVDAARTRDLLPVRTLQAHETLSRQLTLRWAKHTPRIWRCLLLRKSRYRLYVV